MEQIVIDLLKKASDCYYNTENFYEATEEEVQAVIDELGIPCQSMMTDSMFDEIYKRAKDLYPSNPYFLSVGSEVRTGKVKLPIPLGSMTEVKEDELRNWISPMTMYCVSAKLDGCSCLLAYDSGELKIAYSRGDGFNGQDISRTVKQLLGALNNLGVDFTGFVRGEIIIPKDNIPKCIAELKEETGKEYKNGRNLTAGQLNAETANKAFIKYAHFVAYYIDGWKGTTKEMFNKLSELGFETPVNKLYMEEEITDEFMRDLIAKIKQFYVYECDGVICTMNEIDEEHKGFETGTLNPKASRKVKFGISESAETELINIVWQIGKNYKFTPVGILNPINIQGTTINRVSLNNFKFIIDNNIKIGCRGLIKRAGSVIPYWEKTI